MNEILISMATLTTLALILSLLIVFAMIFFAEENNEELAYTISKLPNINCGACGEPGCAALAVKIVNGEATYFECKVLRKEVAYVLQENRNKDESGNTSKI